MKLRCEITAVKHNGETITITMQGSEVGSADWRPMGRHEIDVAATPSNLKSYHLGRIITLELKP